MRLTQGCFSFLPDLEEKQLSLLIDYGLSRKMGVSMEYTQDPHPRSGYWYMWGLPKFDALDAAEILHKIDKCRGTHPNCGLSRGNSLLMEVPSEGEESSQTPRSLREWRRLLLLSRARSAPERLASVGGDELSAEKDALLRDLENARKAEDLALVEELLLRLDRMHPLAGVLPKGWERGGA